MSHLPLRIALPVFCAFMGVHGAGAQTSVADVSRLASTASVNQAVSAPSAFQLSADNGDATATVKLSFAISKPSLESAGRANRPWVFDSGSLAVSSPLSKNGDPTDLASLDGFAGSTSIEFGYRHVSMSLRAVNSRAEEAICERAVDAYAATKDAKSKGVTADSLHNDPTFKCNAAFVSDNLPEAASAYEMAAWGPSSWVRYFGFNGKTGYKDFDFVSPTTLAAQSTRKTEWSLSGFYSVFPTSGGVLYTLKFDHQEGYKAQKDGTLCPLSSGPVAACVSGAIGAPKRYQADLISAEARRDFGTFAAALSATYDATGDVWGVEAPVYLIKSADGGFIGGVRIGWRSDTRDATAGVFFGKTFDTSPF